MVFLGTLKRNVQSVTIDPEDKFFYCGTTTGDILKINFETKLLVVYGPKKNRFSLGVETVREMKGLNLRISLSAYPIRNNFMVPRKTFGWIWQRRNGNYGFDFIGKAKTCFL